MSCNHEDFPCCGCDDPCAAQDEPEFEDEESEDEEYLDEPEDDNFLTDAEADADVLRNCGWGTDEDYGDFGDRDFGDD